MKKRNDLKGCSIKTNTDPMYYPVLIMDGEKVVAQVAIPANNRTSVKFKKAIADALKKATIEE